MSSHKYKPVGFLTGYMTREPEPRIKNVVFSLYKRRFAVPIDILPGTGYKHAEFTYALYPSRYLVFDAVGTGEDEVVVTAKLVRAYTVDGVSVLFDEVGSIDFTVDEDAFYIPLVGFIGRLWKRLADGGIDFRKGIGISFKVRHKPEEYVWLIELLEK